MPAAELFNCLYLWGKQALLRAALVWSIIKYNATWKCIRHETRVWTSHLDFLLVMHFALVHMLTAAVFSLSIYFTSFCSLETLFFSFTWLLSESVVLSICYEQLTFGGQYDHVMFDYAIIALLLSKYTVLHPIGPLSLAVCLFCSP